MIIRMLAVIIIRMLAVIIIRMLAILLAAEAGDLRYG